MSDDRAAEKRARRKRRYGWTKPWWRDRLLWLAVAITAVLVVLESTLSPRQSVLDWGAVAFQGLITWMIVSAVLRIRRGIRRGLVDGYLEAEQKAAAQPSGQSTAESVARASGRTVGRALGAYKRTQRKD